MHEFVAALYEEHVRELTAALALSTGDRETAQDLAHEVFVRALDREEQLRAHPNPRAWLFRTGYGLASNRWKLLLRRRRKMGVVGPTPPQEDWDAVLDLREGLEKLPRRQRDVLILHLYLGYRIPEVASMLGLAEGTVHSHLQRGRMALIDKEVTR
jgi:RNA polymerase sigma-70 factor (ECF subfamily)